MRAERQNNVKPLLCFCRVRHRLRRAEGVKTELRVQLALHAPFAGSGRSWPALTSRPIILRSGSYRFPRTSASSVDAAQRPHIMGVRSAYARQLAKSEPLKESHRDSRSPFPRRRRLLQRRHRTRRHRPRHAPRRLHRRPAPRRRDHPQDQHLLAALLSRLLDDPLAARRRHPHAARGRLRQAAAGAERHRRRRLP